MCSEGYGYGIRQHSGALASLGLGFDHFFNKIFRVYETRNLIVRDGVLCSGGYGYGIRQHPNPDPTYLIVRDGVRGGVALMTMVGRQ